MTPLHSVLRAAGAALAPPQCVSCHAWAGRVDPLCPQCRAALRRLPPEPVAAGSLELWAPVAYEGPARALVRGLKFGAVRRAAEVMAAQMAAGAPAGMLAVNALVPVPLHPARLRRRGFNQAALLAEALGARTGVASWHGLERTGAAQTQVGRGRAQRISGIAGTVRVAGIPPAEVLLVDDVVTTGATMAACAAALRAGGTRRVAGVAYARTGGR